VLTYTNIHMHVHVCANACAHACTHAHEHAHAPSQVDIRLVVPVVLALVGCVYVAASRDSSGIAKGYNTDKLNQIIESRVAYEVQQQLDRKMRLLNAGGKGTKKMADTAASSAKDFGVQKQEFKAPMKKLRVLVTGGAGFVGSHLVDRLMEQGHEVTVLDNMFTGNKRNVQHWIGHPNFNLVQHDVTIPVHIEVDRIYHLACPASPPHYMYNPIKTIKTSVMGTLNMLGNGARHTTGLMRAPENGSALGVLCVRVDRYVCVCECESVFVCVCLCFFCVYVFVCEFVCV